jgi:hypothetical protein
MDARLDTVQEMFERMVADWGIDLYDGWDVGRAST